MSVRITAMRPSAPVRWWMRPIALVGVLAARILGTLKPGRLRRVLELLRRGARPATEQDATRAIDAVLTVSVRASGQWCLERTIAAAVTCRLTGTWPQWCTGVRLQPFQAHAWIAVDDKPIAESPHAMPYFRTVWSVPPMAG